jgi:hypothetical protein
VAVEEVNFYYTPLNPGTKKIVAFQDMAEVIILLSEQEKFVLPGRDASAENGCKYQCTGKKLQSEKCLSVHDLKIFKRIYKGEFTPENM